MQIDEVKRAVILDVVFAEGAVSLDDILEKNGSTRTEFAEWLCEDDFFSSICDLSGRAGEAELARVIKCLAEFAKDGDVKAAKALRSLVGETKSSESDAVVSVSETVAKYKRLDRELFGDEA